MSATRYICAQCGAAAWSPLPPGTCHGGRDHKVQGTVYAGNVTKTGTQMVDFDLGELLGEGAAETAEDHAHQVVDWDKLRPASSSTSLSLGDLFKQAVRTGAIKPAFQYTSQDN